MLQIQLSEYQYLRDLIFIRTGLRVDDSRYDDLMEVLETMLVESRAATIQNLLNMLSAQQTTDKLWQRLVDLITIGETYFFRNKDQFRVLQESILPQMIAERRTQNTRFLRIWSAGCSTGEEPYSIAILLRELIPDIDTWNVTIIGTDLKMANLEFARKAIYRDHSFRMETRSDIKDKWFTPHGRNFELRPEVRRMVAFTPLNLISDEYPTIQNGLMNFDMIVCRNVTIYFEEAVTRQVVKRFHQALTDDGWLMVGHAEPMINTHNEFAPRNFENAIFYKKVREQQPVFPMYTPYTSVLDNKPASPAPAFQPPSQALVETVEVPILVQAKQAADRADWATAIGLLDKAEKEPTLRMQPQLHYLKALVFSHTEDAEGALQSLRRAIYCDPNFALAHYALGEMYEKRGEVREARRHWTLAQSSIRELDPTESLPLDEDLTIEMFNDLLTFRLTNLTGKNP